MSNIAPKFHYFSSQSRKSNMKISILFFFFFLSLFLSLFLLLSSSFSSSITQIVYGVHKRFTHQTNALLSEIFPFLVRAAHELRSKSYGPKHASWWFPVHHFVHNYTHNSKTKGGIRTFYLSSDCSTIRYIYSLG